ncbi:Chitin synthase, class 1 [Geranomyces michiganensis]|nr:Chitin synthase, class 1 [Geranomyces michiganensis]
MAQQHTTHPAPPPRAGSRRPPSWDDGGMLSLYSDFAVPATPANVAPPSFNANNPSLHRRQEAEEDYRHRSRQSHYTNQPQYPQPAALRPPSAFTPNNNTNTATTSSSSTSASPPYYTTSILAQPPPSVSFGELPPPKSEKRGVAFATEAVRAANRFKNPTRDEQEYDSELSYIESLRPGMNPRTDTRDTLMSLSAGGGGGGGGGLLPRRGTVRTRKTIKLPSSGNFTITSHLPESLLNNVAYTKGEEFESVKYTAATCDPNDFVGDGYTLRASSRETEIAIVVTLYNESIDDLNRTFFGLFQNIQHFCQKRKRGWDVDGWKKIVVVLVADGRQKVSPNVLLGLQTMGIYVPGLEQHSVGDKDTTCHIFESTCQLVLDPALQVWTTNNGIPPVQIIFAMKEKNLKKINSHRWFFSAFCPLLNPRVCLLVDVGTRPAKDSIWKLWRAFDRDENCAGACGEIRVDMTWRGLLNPLVASQNFEYKVSNHLDKALESVFGYIGVLPGAFSAYRYKALLDNMPNRGPLASYFKGEQRPDTTSSTEIFTANMNLAEDRILALELVLKPHCRWTLKYVAKSAADTDVPNTVPEFIAQRRRWLNGSFFAQLYSLVNIPRVWGTTHSPLRKAVFMLQGFYSLISLIFAWIGPSQFAIVFFFLFSSDQLINIVPRAVSLPFFFLFPAVLCVLFVASLGNRPQASKNIYKASMCWFALIGIAMMALLGYKISQLFTDNKGLGSIFEIGSGMSYIFSIGVTIGAYVIGSVLQGDAWHLINGSLIQYMIMLPSYINVLQVYSFSNLHDVTWGTKGDNGGAELPKVALIHSAAGTHADVHVAERKDLEEVWRQGISDIKKIHETPQVKAVDRRLAVEDSYKAFRTNLLLAWLSTNLAVFAVVTQTSPKIQNLYVVYLLLTTAGLTAFRLVGVFLYKLFGLVGAIFGSRGPGSKPNRNSVRPPANVPASHITGNKYNGFVVIKDDSLDQSKVFMSA